MRIIFKILALFLAAFWLPATQHCLLETVDFGWSEHGEHHAKTCSLACESDTCQPVESASYLSASVRVKPGMPAEIWVATVFVWLSAPLAPLQASCVPATETPEVDALRRTWQFSARTALLPGAPAHSV